MRNLSLGQTSDVVIGSSLGSALGQIGLVLGLVGLSGQLSLPRHMVYRHGGVMLGSLALLAWLARDGEISRPDGLLLIVAYLIYFLVLLSGKSARDPHAGRSVATSLQSWAILLVGLGLVIGSAEATVRAATSVADSLGVEQSMIAIVVIGVGTSLPELSISLAAVLLKRSGLSVGNLIGSNIFDTLMPIGIAGTISGLDFNDSMLRSDLPFLVLLSIVVLVFFIRDSGIQKREALLLLGLYTGYAALRIGHA